MSHHVHCCSQPGRNVLAAYAVALFACGPTPFTLAEAERGFDTQRPEKGVAERAANDGVDGNPEVDLIDRHIRQGWKKHDLRPSAIATDGEWCRRIFLDVIGRVPTVDELTEFLRDSSRSRRASLVDRVLSAEYQQEYARNWAAVWTNILIGRTGGTGNDSLADRAGMQAYLRQSFEYGKPYDEMVRELITATGSVRPGDADFNGAANFLVDKLREGGVQAAAKTAQVFLGMSVACTQCHNHPFNEYGQNQFWELNAFFRQAAVEVVRDGDTRGGRVIDRDFAGEGRRQHWQMAREVVWKQKGNDLVDSRAAERAAAPIFYEQRTGKVKMAFPSFIDGTSLESIFEERGSVFGNSGYLEHVHRRRELAQLILASPQLDLAIVNRVWAHFLGYGFTKPFDDMGPHNPPSHPELLEELASSFRASDYHFKSLIRWILLSKPYALSSRATRSNKADNPALGNRPMFSRFYLRQMQAEQLYDSLLIVTKAEQTLSRSEAERTKQAWLNQFSRAFGTDENDESTAFNGSIRQTLVLMNSDLIKRATSAEQGSALSELADNGALSNGERIRHLYLAALSRLPTREEISMSNQLLATRDGNVTEALQDICWALLNCNEFILNH